jgi:carnitine O-acetyltransferase
MYAMHSLIQRDIQAQRAAKEKVKGSGDGTSSRRSSDNERDPDTITVPEIFTDPGYGLLGTSVLSTSNCGNPALRLFGFGPVTPEGYGIGQLTGSCCSCERS